MNDFVSHLTALLDDVAAGINPQPDFEALQSPTVPIVTTPAVAGRRFRGPLGIAAASVALFAGSVAAYQVADGEPTSVLTSGSEIDSSDDADVAPQRPSPDGGDKSPTIVVPVVPVVPDVAERELDPIHDPEIIGAERSARLGMVDVDGDKLVQRVIGVAAPGEVVSVASEHGPTAIGVARASTWKLSIVLSGLAPGESTELRVTFGFTDEVVELSVTRPAAEAPEPKPASEPEPKPEEPEQAEPKPPTEEPAPIAFTTHLGSPYNDATYMKQGFWGTAPAGAKITASSDWGAVDTTAGPKGEWEMRLVLVDVPDGAVIHVVVRSSTGGAFEYDLVRAEPVPFTSNPGGSHLGDSPMKQGFYGTGTPGSVVRAKSEYGANEAVVGADGHWEMGLVMYEVPAGAVVHVRVTNNATDGVFEYELQRPGDEPEPVAFTAEAAFVECDSTPPFNEYWGAAPAGATITIASPYGGTSVTANGEGHWEARVEFPDAPLGETFYVKISSSGGGDVKKLPFKRVEPT
jgi:hypothetical protein